MTSMTNDELLKLFELLIRAAESGFFVANLADAILTVQAELLKRI